MLHKAEWTTCLNPGCELETRIIVSPGGRPQCYGCGAVVDRRAEFEAHLKQASAIVDTWPDWKKNCLGRIDHE